MPLKNYLFFILLFFNILYCRAVDRKFISDSIVNKQIENGNQLSDSLIQADSIFVSDSVGGKEKKKKKDVLEDKVFYSAEDSMIISVTGQVLHLYGNANVKYTDIELKSDYIMLDLANKEVFAKGLPDTSGKVIGPPIFSQKNEAFSSDSMRYNFDTKKGVIFNIVTKQGEGYFISEKTKRLENEHINAMNNKYTTCPDTVHPHFYLALKKALVIPEDKIVSGRAYMVVQDVPLPLMIPFGFFPNSRHRASGILMPTYDNDASRGIGLRQGGWYQVLNDYADLTLLGNFYSRGSWGLNTGLSYKWKYHFAGNFSFEYNVNKISDEADYPVKKDYAVRWTHSQDAKSTPNQTFSASVNFSSRQNDLRNSYSYDRVNENVTSSSINYARSWPNSGVNLAISASANQNKKTDITTLNFPTGSFNVSTKYPFRKEGGSGKYKWYENISIGYQSKFQNTVSTNDSIILTNKVFDRMENGFRHDIPITMNFKIGKMITLGPSFNYTGMVYTRHINRTVELVNDSTYNIIDDTIRALSYIHAFNPSAGISFSPKIYGMFVSTKEGSYIKAVRHVMSPSASFSFTPDMREVNPNYYEKIVVRNSKDSIIYQELYNKFGDEPYGVPSSYGKSGTISLGLGNTLEMKVMPKNDTTGKPKKVILLKNLNFNSGYNPFADSLRWNPVTFSTGTSFFNNKLSINVNGSMDPYTIDTLGRRINKYVYNQRGVLFRLTSVSVSSGFSLQSQQGKKSSKESGDESEQGMENDARIDESMDFIPGSNAGDYVNYDIPWSVNVSYSWSYSKQGLKENISHSVNFRGDLSITKNWKVGFSSGYDIKQKEVTFTNLSFSRDLHCWQMSFTVVPFGDRRSYSFNIHAKSQLLQDLKYDLRPNTWYDKF